MTATRARSVLCAGLAGIGIRTAAPPVLRAQQTAVCDLVQQPNTHIYSENPTTPQARSFAGGGVLIRCPARKITLGMPFYGKGWSGANWIACS